MTESLALEKQEARAQVEELESALAEMASQLEHAKIDHDDMKDLHQSLTGHSWVDEKTIKTCKLCTKDFTIKRRKVIWMLKSLPLNSGYNFQFIL